VCAIGAMITPATPVRVKSGTKATAIMSVEENTGGPTARAAAAMRSKTEPPRRAKLRKMLSIMITDESTTMPKSTAPSEMRLAWVPSIPCRRMRRAGQWQGECDQQGGAQLAQKKPQHQRDQHQQ